MAAMNCTYDYDDCDYYYYFYYSYYDDYYYNQLCLGAIGTVGSSIAQRLTRAVPRRQT